MKPIVIVLLATLFVITVASFIYIQSDHADHGYSENHEQEHSHAENDHGEGGHDEDGHDKGGHEEQGHAHAEQSQIIEINDKQQAIANIKTQIVTKDTYSFEVYAPAEVQANGYTRYRVSPRVDSVVLYRHVTLGEHVKKGSKLVTLFSENMAHVQASYLVAYEQWKRLQGLGTNNTSERELFEAKTEYQAQRGVLKSFGLDEKVIEQLNKRSDVALGEYTLKAAIDGVVLSDGFQQGQQVAAGGPLIDLANEESLWVEARLNSSFNGIINSNTRSRVRINDRDYEANVQQEAHILDPITRTRIVRLIIEPKDHSVHPGMFADVYFQFQSEQPTLAVKEGALLRTADGHWQVYIKQSDQRFVAKDVTLGKQFGDYRQVYGIEPGTEVVTEGAFFVASQGAKSNFDPHNH